LKQQLLSPPPPPDSFFIALAMGHADRPNMTLFPTCFETFATDGPLISVPIRLTLVGDCYNPLPADANTASIPNTALDLNVGPIRRLLHGSRDLFTLTAVTLLGIDALIPAALVPMVVPIRRCHNH
jgi:hypothetical protein